jgi:hypothetical protein
MFRILKSGILVLGAAVALSGCQSPTEPDDVIVVDVFVEASQTPNPAEAGPGDGRTFEKPQAELPSLILPYDWKVRFGVQLLVNGTATDKDLHLKFPIDITSVNIAVQQCSSGIVIPPSGDAIYATHDVAGSTGSSFSGVNSTNTLTLDVWYDLPNGRKEACIDVNVGLKWKNDDNLEITGAKTLRVRVGG